MTSISQGLATLLPPVIEKGFVTQTNLTNTNEKVQSNTLAD